MKSKPVVTDPNVTRELTLAALAWRPTGERRADMALATIRDAYTGFGLAAALNVARFMSASTTPYAKEAAARVLPLLEAAAATETTEKEA